VKAAPASRTFKLSELARIAGGRVTGDGDTTITGVAGIRDARPGEITFLANPKYQEFVSTTRASALIGPRGMPCGVPTIEMDDPYIGFLRVLSVFAEARKVEYPKGIHPTAIIDPGARVDEGASVGPHCQVCRGARIGRNSTVLLGAFIGEGVVIGENCLIYPNVTIREGTQIGDRVILHSGVVVGSDGFGFARDGEVNRKIPQIGIVVIEDDVEIGANSTVDRATIGVTRICSGTKIDNLVMIAHNVVVGKNSMLAAQVGISGSTEVGEGVIMAGQAGCVGHIRIGNRVIVGAQSGVSKSIPDDTTVFGYPAREHQQAKKLLALTRRLPEMNETIKRLEKRIQELEEGRKRDQAAKDDS
jgi:UDP-3-O-[3-hydroxymyristoyl] glucosamine N-acyltransferase